MKFSIPLAVILILFVQQSALSSPVGIIHNLDTEYRSIHGYTFEVDCREFGELLWFRIQVSWTSPFLSAFDHTMVFLNSDHQALNLSANWFYVDSLREKRSQTFEFGLSDEIARGSFFRCIARTAGGSNHYVLQFSEFCDLQNE
jgi:hypothetical protein